MSESDVPEVETCIHLRQNSQDPSEASLPEFNLQPHPRKGIFVENM